VPSQDANGENKDAPAQYFNPPHPGPLPPPPPPGHRFYQILTEETQAVVVEGSGELYDAIVKALIAENPDYFADAEEVQRELEWFIWPPRQAREYCFDLPHIPKFGSHLRFKGKIVQLLVTDIVDNASLVAERYAIIIGVSSAFGGIEELDRLKREFIETEGTAEEFEARFAEELTKQRKIARRP